MCRNSDRQPRVCAGIRSCLIPMNLAAPNASCPASNRRVSRMRRRATCLPAITGCPDGGSKSTWWNCSPRIGFAYNVGGERQDHVSAAASACSISLRSSKRTTTWWTARHSARKFCATGVPFSNPYTGIRNPFPAEYAPYAARRRATSSCRWASPFRMRPDWKPARTMSYNLTVEHQLRGRRAGPRRLRRLQRHAPRLQHGRQCRRVSSPARSDIDAQLAPSVPAVRAGHAEHLGRELELQLAATVASTSASRTASRSGRITRSSRSLDWVSYLTDLDGINVINPFNLRALSRCVRFQRAAPFRPELRVADAVARRQRSHAVLGGWETSRYLELAERVPARHRFG